MNTLFRIAFGDYEFVLDRTNLTYSLTETVTKTVWATALSLGWIELKDRATGAVTRTDFGECKLISIAEKMGAAGKRILLGLDAPGGVPIDIYLICGSKDIQLTVEASRDSKTHLLERVGLLPGLASVCTEGEYLFWPTGDDQWPEHLFWEEAEPSHEIAGSIWYTLRMPFLGAVRRESALALLTDSAYATARVSYPKSGMAFNWEYQRDPERRRLDIRIVVLPKGDGVAICKAYRDKLVGERHHRTLRMRMRERPQLESLLGAVAISPITPIPKQEIPEGTLLALPARWQRVHEFPKPIVMLPQWLGLTAEQEVELIHAWQSAGWRMWGTVSIGSDEPLSYTPHYQEPRVAAWREAGMELVSAASYNGLMGHPDGSWEEMEQRLREVRELQTQFSLITGGLNDWMATTTDFCWQFDSCLSHAVVWRDAIVTFSSVAYTSRAANPFLFPRQLLFLDAPLITLGTVLEPIGEGFLAAALAILCPLHQLTFAAFLKSHRFLTPDRQVQETLYTDGTRVVANFREDNYETDEFLLPPGGFYVRHPQFEAHDALRVGTVAFSQRAWRVRRSLDGKPLEQSVQVEEREFEV
ncbi:MAG: hypothetical protein NTX57_18055 [Armatimonadetes bacterium]|nr:hypothetical protein [Armatimonadota bacterium]